MTNAPDSPTTRTEPDTRYEVKMVGQAAAYSRLRMFLRTDRAGVRVLYPPRIVQSIYLDTWTNAALEENLAGISHREKIRFRWYGDARTDVRGILERKVRENMLGWKDLAPIDATLAVEGQTRRGFSQSLLAHLDAGWSEVATRSLLPVQWIRYEREYYRAGSLRITIDRALRTWDQRTRYRLSARFRTPTPDVMIVEVKTAAENDAELQGFLNRVPLHVDKCSKFVYASAPGEGAMPSYLPI